MLIDTTDGSGHINTDYMAGLVAYSSSSSHFTIALRQRFGVNMHSGGTTADIGIGPVFPTKVDAQSAVADFVSRAGFPWAQIGLVPNPTSNGIFIVAVNLDSVAQMIDNTGTGIDFNGGGMTSGGYDPWIDGPTAIAALGSLMGVAELS